MCHSIFHDLRTVNHTPDDSVSSINITNQNIIYNEQNQIFIEVENAT